MSSETLRCEVVGLSQTEKEFLATAIAVFTDPHPRMQEIRGLLMGGTVALGVEGDEVTWVDGPGEIGGPLSVTKPAAGPGHCICEVPLPTPAPGGGFVCIGCNRRTWTKRTTSTHTNHD